jgi:ribonuclease BN (tRNA processing enzyme)
VQPSDSTLHPPHRSTVAWANYVRQYHTTALQLGKLAARARPKLLVISHNGRRVSDEVILADIRRSFAGPVVIAADLQRF